MKVSRSDAWPLVSLTLYSQKCISNGEKLIILRKKIILSKPKSKRPSKDFQMMKMKKKRRIIVLARRFSKTFLSFARLKVNSVPKYSNTKGVQESTGRKS